MADKVVGGRRLGLIADPDVPEQVAGYLAESLPGHRDDAHEWSVQVEVDPVTAGKNSTAEMLEASDDRRKRHGWDYAICVTDLPVRDEQFRPVLAEADLDHHVGLVSLPALGATQPYRRARQVLQQLLDELTAPARATAAQAGGDSARPRHGLKSPLTELLGPIHRENITDYGAADIRYRATRTRGRARLLAGMVRTNRPWRLIFGLSSAMAAALATSAFGLSSSTIWQIADRLGGTRQVVAAFASVALLTGWLITAHHLWEVRSRARDHDRELVVLYNCSTVLTLITGVGCMYVLLLAVNIAVASFLLPATLLPSVLGHPVGWTTYLSLAWGFTTMGVVAGALGSSLETDEAVRQAAYGYREEQRRTTTNPRPTDPDHPAARDAR